MQDYRQSFILKLEGYPLLKTHFGESLVQRMHSSNWFENGLILAILRNSDAPSYYENILQKGNIRQIENSKEIFSVLRGDDRYYDLKIFDVLAEICLLQWANANGYTNIKKLTINKDNKFNSVKTPDFEMQIDRKI